MILKATTKHLKDLIQIEQECFGSDCFKLSKNNFIYHIKKGNIFVFSQNKLIAGYILLINYQKSLRVYSLAVKKEFQNMQIAYKLCNECIKFAKSLNKNKIILEVRKSNQKAINLYEKLNFKKAKILNNYYENEDGIKYILLLL